VIKKSIKIAILGPESTGKTVLTQHLSQYFKAPWLPELSRSFIENLNRNYTYSDVETIAHLQITQEDTLQKQHLPLYFLDTELIITKIWFAQVFKKIPDWFEQELQVRLADFYLLCDTSIPWTPDKVRENGGERREFLYRIYKNELNGYKVPYKVVTNMNQQRFSNAVNAVSDFISGFKNNPG